MLSASSLSAASSKIRRGFVADSVRTARGRSRNSVVVVRFMGGSPLSGWVVQVGSGEGGGTRRACSRPRSAGLRHVGFRFFGRLCRRLFEGREDYGGSFLD